MRKVHEIAFYRDFRRGSELLELIEGLNKKAVANPNERIILRQIRFYISILERLGISAGGPLVQQVQDEVWEMASGGNRVILFTLYENQIVLLHHFRKTTKKAPRNEVEKALAEIGNWKAGVAAIDKQVKWEDIKNSMLSLSKEEVREVDLMTEIITAIIERRQELGISQRELERITGVRQEMICQIENPRSVMRLNTLIKVMEPLGLRLYIDKI